MHGYDIREDSALKWWASVDEHAMTARHNTFDREWVEENLDPEADADKVAFFDEHQDTHGDLFLPFMFKVCPVCTGRGRHVNPSIDAGGLTLEDFDEDPGFEGDYFGGMYDVTCNLCRSKRVIPEPDFGVLPGWFKDLFDESIRDDQQYAAVCRAERAMGA